MKALLLVLYVLVSLFACAHAGLTAYTVPMHGINVPPQQPCYHCTTTTTMNCQLITGVANIIQYGFWLDVTGGYPNDYSIQAWTGAYDGSNMVYSNTGAQALKGANKAYHSGKTWQYYYYQGSIGGLGYGAANAICLVPTPGNTYGTFNWAQNSAGVTGAFVHGSHSSYGTNLFFTLIANNFVLLPSVLNWVDLYHPSASTCNYRTTYTGILVDYINMNIWTNHYEMSTTAIRSGQSGSCPAASTLPSPAPYGQPSACSGLYTYNTAYMDLRGTGFKFADTWAAYGSGAYSAYALSANNQVLDLIISGTCGFAWTPSAYAGLAYGAGSYGNLGGPYINIAVSIVT